MPTRYIPTVVAMIIGLAVPTLGFAQDRTVQETIDLEPGGALTLKADRGTVEVTSWNQPRVDINVRIEPPSGVDDDYARRAVEGTTIQIQSTGRSVSIQADYSGVPVRGVWGRRMPRVHYRIRAPRQLDLDLDIDRSDTVLDGFEGRIIATVDRSDVIARDLNGEISLNLDRGELDASGVSGQLTLDVDRGRRVVLDGVQASLALDSDRTNVTMRDVAISRDSVVEIDRGDFDLQLDVDQPLTVEAALSRRADLSTELPISITEHGREFSGTINGGGPLLQIIADRSQVRLRRN